MYKFKKKMAQEKGGKPIQSQLESNKLVTIEKLIVQPL